MPRNEHKTSPIDTEKVLSLLNEDSDDDNDDRFQRPTFVPPPSNDTAENLVNTSPTTQEPPKSPSTNVKLIQECVNEMVQSMDPSLVREVVRLEDLCFHKFTWGKHQYCVPCFVRHDQQSAKDKGAVFTKTKTEAVRYIGKELSWIRPFGEVRPWGKEGAINHAVAPSSLYSMVDSENEARWKDFRETLEQDLAQKVNPNVHVEAEVQIVQKYMNIVRQQEKEYIELTQKLKLEEGSISVPENTTPQETQAAPTLPLEAPTETEDYTAFQQLELCAVNSLSTPNKSARTRTQQSHTSSKRARRSSLVPCSPKTNKEPCDSGPVYNMRKRLRLRVGDVISFYEPNRVAAGDPLIDQVVKLHPKNSSSLVVELANYPWPLPGDHSILVEKTMHRGKLVSVVGSVRCSINEHALDLKFRPPEDILDASLASHVESLKCDLNSIYEEGFNKIYKQGEEQSGGTSKSDDDDNNDSDEEKSLLPPPHSNHLHMVQHIVTRVVVESPKEGILQEMETEVKAALSLWQGHTSRRGKEEAQARARGCETALKVLSKLMRLEKSSGSESQTSLLYSLEQTLVIPVSLIQRFLRGDSKKLITYPRVIQLERILEEWLANAV